MVRYKFSHWEDGSTNPTRTIVLVADMTITATYELAPPISPIDSILIIVTPFTIGLILTYLGST